MSLHAGRGRGGVGSAVAALLLVLLSLPVFFYGLDHYGTINFDEAVYHAICRHMAESGDWTRLVYLGKEHVYDTFMKAPAQHWARATVILLFGDTYVAARLLSAAFGAGTVLVAGALARRLGRPRAGLLAGLVTLTSFQLVFLHGARTGESDSIVCFFVAATALAFLRAVHDGKRWLGHHACLLLLANVKLPLAAPVVAAEALLLVRAREGRARIRGWLLTALALSPVAFAWHAAQWLRLEGEGADVLATMVSEAAGSPDGAPQGSPLENLRYYAAVLLYGFAPYLPAAVLAAAWAVWSPAEKRRERRWMLLFPAAVLAFFLVVSKRMPWYVLPVYPFLACALGLLLDDVLAGRAPRRLQAVLPAFAVGAVCARALPTDVDAFRTAAFQLDPELAWRGGVWTALATVLLAVLGLALAHRGRSLVRLLGGAAGLALLVLGGARTASMLTRLEWISPVERQALALRELAERGAPIDFPVPLAGSDFRLARALLADQFRLRRASPGSPYVGTVEGLRARPRRPLGSSAPVPRPWSGLPGLAD